MGARSCSVGYYGIIQTLKKVNCLSPKTKSEYSFWISAFAGSTRCCAPTVIPARAGIQYSNFFQPTWTFWVEKKVITEAAIKEKDRAIIDPSF